MMAIVPIPKHNIIIFLGGFYVYIYVNVSKYSNNFKLLNIVFLLRFC